MLSSFSLWLNPCPFLQERFYTKAEEVEKDVTINVTNEFDPYGDYGGRSNNVRHVERSGLPQFTATEETVIGLNESREVFRDFEKNGGFDDVPVQFLTIAHLEISTSTHQESVSQGHSLRPRILCWQTSTQLEAEARHNSPSA
jgi:hypothetical protein